MIELVALARVRFAAEVPHSILAWSRPSRPLDRTGRLLLLGSRDAGSPLALLGGHADVLGLVYGSVRGAREAAVCAAALAPGRKRGAVVMDEDLRRAFPMTSNRPSRWVDGQRVPSAAPADAPEPIRVNMLPFVMGEKSSLPTECRKYYGLVKECLKCLPEVCATSAHATRLVERATPRVLSLMLAAVASCAFEPRVGLSVLYRSVEALADTSWSFERHRAQEATGQVGYLTIDEGWVEAGESQRRGGVHTDGFAVEDWAGRAPQGCKQCIAIARCLECPVPTDVVALCACQVRRAMSLPRRSAV